MIRLKEAELDFMCWVRSKERNLITAICLLCTRLGASKGWTTLSLCIIFLYDSTFGWAIGLAAAFGAIASQVIKRQVRRKRPFLHPKAPTPLASIPDPWSFPSGHTSTAFSVTAMLWTVNSSLLWPFALFALLVGWSRIYLGVHYPTDVLMGAILGMICGSTFGVIWY